MYELVPDDFEVPAGLEHERFRLRMPRIDDVVKDFDAICDRVDHRGEPQPPFVEARGLGRARRELGLSTPRSAGGRP